MHTSELERLRTYLRTHIPLSTAMQVQVVHYDGQSLQLSAPLACNHNDKGTAFAGSIASLAALSGWALLMLWAAAEEGDCQVAIARAELDYRKPLRGDFCAQATLPEAAELQALRVRLQERGRCRVPVRVEVSDRDGMAVVQHAEYAVWRPQPAA